MQSPSLTIYYDRDRQNVPSGTGDQWLEWPSSLLLVANRIEAAKTAMIMGTTTKGEVICMRQSSLLLLRVAKELGTVNMLVITGRSASCHQPGNTAEFAGYFRPPGG